jgi:uncharacterized Zn finger protein
MSWYSFRPYVPVAERRRQSAKAAQKLTKGGRALAPIAIQGRIIATSFWGKAWCDNLEAYSDYANRLPRGRTYVRNGSVIDLQIGAGKITALVQGSDLYKIAVAIRPLAPTRWKRFQTTAAGKITNLLELLQGRLGRELLTDISAPGTGLFPAPAEIELDCSCPDWADMCKHVAAVLYGIGARLDTKPELFFTLRGVDMQDLLTAASATAAAPVGDGQAAAALAGADLSEIFGVNLEDAASVGTTTAAVAVPQAQRARAAKKPRAQAAIQPAGRARAKTNKAKPQRARKA